MVNKKKKITLTNSLLEEIAAAMDDNSCEHKWYLDVQSEETILVSDYSDDDPELSESIEEGYNERFFQYHKRSPAKDGNKWNDSFIHLMIRMNEPSICCRTL